MDVQDHGGETALDERLVRDFAPIRAKFALSAEDTQMAPWQPRGNRRLVTAGSAL
jgi:hypothetical protein